MKLESEGDNSLCFFISAERRNDDGGAAGVGCSAGGRERHPFAQVSHPSIGPDATDADGDGRSRGCGAQSLPTQRGKELINGFHADSIVTQGASEPQGLTSLNCEHFRFIDDDADDADIPPSSNGISDHEEQPNGGVADNVRNGHDDYTEENRHLREDHKKQMEVSECDLNSNKASVDPVPVDMCDASVESCACVVSRELKSVLKKGKNGEKKPKRARVTFDEAVTLYSDEFEDVQMLALRSAAEVNCAEVFYMFEPPIEYQDLMLPFEPPAEYRDPDTTIEENGKSTPTTVQDVEANADEASATNGDQEDEAGVESKEVKEEQEQNQHENIDSYSTGPTDGGDVKEDENRENGRETSDPKQQQQQQVDPTEESEKLFERFLEAEREFDEDEELNRVFHVLENDLAGDEKNGTFDDNFFKKLINLLSAVEGDVQLQEGDFFTTTDFSVNEEEQGKDTEDDDQAPSRTLSEADSDCSVSSQDTIIVRFGDDEVETAKRKLCRQNSENENQAEDSVDNAITEEEQGIPTSLAPENFDEVFSEEPDTPTCVCDESQPKLPCVRLPTSKPEQVNSNNSSNSSGDLSRQSSGEQPPKDIVQDADDSTSSDSRSGEVEEDIKLDDIGYDEEDADDYDEECLRGMVRGNSKIRRIIKKNALQCTLFRGIEARRRQQPGSKYPRPKSPPLSQESLVEQLKWLTTVDDKDVDNFSGSKPPDVILSTGSVPLNGGMPQCTSSEDEFSGGPYRYPAHYPRHMVGQENKGPPYHIQPASYPVPHASRPLRPWTPSNAQVPQQFQRPAYPAPRAIVRPMPSQIPYPDERLTAVSPVPRDYRDWRVIQRVMVNREDGNFGPSHDFKRCPNSAINAYRRVLPTQSHDELEQFVQQGSQRIERIRKRYSVAEEDDDPTFGFARRPSVRGIQNRLQPSGPHYQPSEVPLDVGTKYLPSYTSVESAGQGPVGGTMRPRNPPEMVWGPNSNWRQSEPTPVYCASGLGTNRPPGPIPIHRGSLALTELPGCATLPHPKSHSDTRYHSYAENIYSGSQTLPHKRWNSMDPRTCIVPGATTLPRQVVAHPLPRMQGPAIAQPSLQVPPRPPLVVTSDERGVPEGASSSPKVSSDSLYHGPLQEPMPVGTSHKDDGVIYYSMNV